MNRSRQNSDSKNSTSSDPKINEGEKVLCYHGSLIYEAKCLKIRESEDEPDKMEYFIHYAGWSKKWEEWVDETRILKYTEENIKKQKSLKEEGKAAKKSVGTPGRKSSTTDKDKDSGSSRPCSPAVSVKSNKSNQDTSGKDDLELPEPKKRKSSNLVKEKEKEKENDSKPKAKEKEKESSKEVKENVKPEEEVIKSTPAPPPAEPKYRIRLELPEVLTRILNNDTHFILEQQFLTTVPADLTCKHLFDEFLQSKGPEKASEMKRSGLIEFVHGLQRYIDEMLGVQLLYRFEKLQYKSIKEKYPSTPLHTLYCPILVLRLICNLEKALTPTMTLTPKGLKLIDTHLKDFLKYLVDNYDKYFNRNFYDAATPEYLRMTLK